MVAPLPHPVAIKAGEHMPHVMRAIGNEIQAWEDGTRSEKEAMMRIHLLIKAERALDFKHTPERLSPPKLRVKRRSST